VRRAAHAGTFYPADPTVLAAQVDALLAAARSQRSSRSALPLGLLVPHAGIDWSGPVAARGWLELEPDPVAPGPPPTVVLLGTNHFARRSRGISAWSGGPWWTPLGEVAVDEALRHRILALGGPVVGRSEPHLDEHSIEVELPFLARVRPDARIVPLLVGPLDERELRVAGAAFGRLVAEVLAAGDPVVLAASSDLAHYPSRVVAEQVDAESLRAIVALDADRLARHEAAAESAAIVGLDCALCGIEPAVCLLAALRALGATAGTVLAHATSADAPLGEPNHVVGYAAVRFD
jgi:hypothetical protein